MTKFLQNTPVDNERALAYEVAAREPYKPMQKKSGKWLADWRDEHGKRHRKAFKTKARAAAYQKRQFQAASSKKARA